LPAAFLPLMHRHAEVEVTWAVSAELASELAWVASVELALEVLADVIWRAFPEVPLATRRELAMEQGLAMERGLVMEQAFSMERAFAMERVFSVVAIRF
jgi:hypothetical protein